MKKQLFLMSALALTTLATTSCGTKGNQPYEPGTPLKVGLICLHKDSTYDKNFISAFNAACEAAKEKGYVSEYEIKTDVPEEGRDCYDAAEQFVNRGFNIVFSDSFGHDVSMHEAAEEFTNVQFSSATGIEARKSGLTNFHNAFASIYEGRYLEGVAAGQLLKEKYSSKTEGFKVGYVGAYPYAEVISGFTSWFLGVQSILGQGKVTMDVEFTNSWYDQNAENAKAKSLISKGCDLISQHADSMGAPAACEETAKTRPDTPVYNVSYNISTKDECPKTYLGYSKIDWEPYYYNFIESTFKGETIKDEKEQNWTGTIETGSVKYAVDGSMVTDAITKAVADAAKELKNGKKIFDTSTFTVSKLPSLAEWYTKQKLTPPEKNKDYEIDGEGHLTKMMGATDMYARDTNLVETDDKGVTYIKESSYRSAPSFDFIIDAINVQ